MNEQEPLDRRSLLAALAGVTITITACGSDDASPTAATAQAKTGEISDNHGHLALIRGPQLAAAQALNLDIHGTADHTHEVALTNAEVRSIRDGARVTKTASSASGHRHTVTFN